MKFLRALHPKWRAKVPVIEESKDLTSLSLDELIRNLKCSTFGSEDEEYAMMVRDFRKFFKRRECPKPPKDKKQRAFVRGSWSDSGEEDDKKVTNTIKRDKIQAKPDKTEHKTKSVEKSTVKSQRKVKPNKVEAKETKKSKENKKED
nr:hypothetical protein [Tanacetum cinerariifolium]